MTKSKEKRLYSSGNQWSGGPQLTEKKTLITNDFRDGVASSVVLTSGHYETNNYIRH